MVKRNSIPRPMNNLLKIHKAWYAVILLLIAFGIREGCNKSFSDDILTKLDSYKDTALHYKGLHNSDIAYNQAFQVKTQKDFEAVIRSMSDTVQALAKSFKRLQSIKTTSSTFYLPRDSIPYPVKIPCSFDPIPIARDCTYYKLYARVAPDRLYVDSLKVPNKQTIVTGEMKRKLFKKAVIEMHVVNSNKYVTTSAIQSFEYSPKKKFLERPVVVFVGGFIVGGVVAYKVMH